MKVMKRFITQEHTRTLYGSSGQDSRLEKLDFSLNCFVKWPLCVVVVISEDAASCDVYC